jgi:hypothetical protein
VLTRAAVSELGATGLVSFGVVGTTVLLTELRDVAINAGACEAPFVEVERGRRIIAGVKTSELGKRT